jgi:lysyl-tRNA synthetase class 1
MKQDDIAGQLSARKLWPYAEAKKVLERHGYDREYTYRFESGFGPSGFPHIGTFGEVLRTNFIMQAVREFGFRTKLIVFSDDLDGLRKVPEGMPAWLAEHLGKPVSSIPDPFGEHGTFSEHMNARLRDMLATIGGGIEYEFRSSRAAYESGEFDEGIRILLKDFKKLEEIIAPTLSEDTLRTWYPFFPICENCGKVLTTVVTGVDAEAATVSYECRKPHETVKGCGHVGTQSALGGRGKLTWRVDWPLRWYALKIDYELYGKDLIDSFAVGRKIMRGVFGAPEPASMYYEMFLDEQGAKISKSKGKGLGVAEWLTYGTPESLNLLMFRKPQKAKELSLQIIPRYVDDAIAIARDRTGKPEAVEHEHDFILDERAGGKAYPPEVSYGLICNLMTALKSTDGAMLKNYLGEAVAGGDGRAMDELIEKAGAYYRDFMLTHRQEFQFTEGERALLARFAIALGEDLEADAIHSLVYDIAVEAGVPPAELFKTLYHALIGQDRGPRLGSFIKMIGREKAVELLNSAGA